MTKEKLLELFENHGLHISDGMGDNCSGEDREAMEAAAEEIVAHWNVEAEEKK